MKKIKFNQPKYVLPLIFFPFLFLGYFLGFGQSNNDDVVKDTTYTAGINTSVPDVDSTISNQALSNKFSAYQSAFINAKDRSAMGDIYQDPMTGQVYQSIYSDEQINEREAQRIMDSINRVYGNSGGFINNEFGGSSTRKSTATASNNAMDDYYQMQNEINAMMNATGSNSSYGSSNYSQATSAAVNEYEQQMNLFREQMRMVDSMQNNNAKNGNQTNNGQRYQVNNKGVRYEFTRDTGFNPVTVEAVGNKNLSGFNTIRNSTRNAGKIMAMIDQDVKATAGSRVRIRLLSDMFAGDQLIPKGTYVYGFVTGFQTQRVNVSVRYIQVGDESIPVQLDLFDNDGYLGLYVPGSNFREFTKEIGTRGTQGMSSMVMPDGSNVVSNILSQIFNSTTTTAANLIRKNKANIKYNYIVYLRDASNL